MLKYTRTDSGYIPERIVKSKKIYICHGSSSGILVGVFGLYNSEAQTKKIFCQLRKTERKHSVLNKTFYRRLEPLQKWKEMAQKHRVSLHFCFCISSMHSINIQVHVILKWINEKQEHTTDIHNIALLSTVIKQIKIVSQNIMFTRKTKTISYTKKVTYPLLRPN